MLLNSFSFPDGTSCHTNPDILALLSPDDCGGGGGGGGVSVVHSTNLLSCPPSDAKYINCYPLAAGFFNNIILALNSAFVTVTFTFIFSDVMYSFITA